jgi:hypothetical protein
MRMHRGCRNTLQASSGFEEHVRLTLKLVCVLKAESTARLPIVRHLFSRTCSLVLLPDSYLIASAVTPAPLLSIVQAFRPFCSRWLCWLPTTAENNPENFRLFTQLAKVPAQQAIVKR